MKHINALAKVLQSHIPPTSVVFHYEGLHEQDNPSGWRVAAFSRPDLLETVEDELGLDSIALVEVRTKKGHLLTSEIRRLRRKS